MSKSYAIYVEIGSICKPILTLIITNDGSFSIQDRVNLNGQEAIYRIIQFQFPNNLVGARKRIILDKPIYFSKNKPKLSHHSESGKFQISSTSHRVGYKILSGFTETGEPKCIGNQSVRLNKESNDGGPIFSGVFWGINNMPIIQVNSSKEIVFQNNQIKDQAMNNSGQKPGLAIHFFHFFKNNNRLDYIDNQWARYSHKLYKKPALVNIVDPGKSHPFLLGISCMSMRLNDQSEYGYRIGGGPGIIDLQTGSCLNTDIFFEMPSPSLPLNAINIDYNESILSNLENI